MVGDHETILTRPQLLCTNRSATGRQSVVVAASHEKPKMTALSNAAASYSTSASRLDVEFKIEGITCCLLVDGCLGPYCSKISLSNLCLETSPLAWLESL